jgi:hypothetical protein
MVYLIYHREKDPDTQTALSPDFSPADMVTSSASLPQQTLTSGAFTIFGKQ